MNEQRTPPAPPPPPPSRTIRDGLFGQRETKESIRAREDYEVYMRGWSAGFAAGRGTT